MGPWWNDCLGFGGRRRPKKEVPTISLWMSCFILFRRALLMAEPHRGAELDAYAECILDAARANRWEFVRIYDRKFRQAAVGDQTRSWAVLDPSLFTKEVTGPQATFLASTRAPAGPDKKDGAATSGASRPEEGEAYGGPGRLGNQAGGGGRRVPALQLAGREMFVWLPVQVPPHLCAVQGPAPVPAVPHITPGVARSSRQAQGPAQPTEPAARPLELNYDILI